MSEEQKVTPNNYLGEAIVSFFIPLVGIILYFVWRDEKPIAANKVIKFSIAGLCTILISYIIVFSSLFGSIYDDQSLNASQQENDSPQIDYSQQIAEFEQRISSLKSASQTEDVSSQLEQTHLEYGIYLIYNADPTSMRENANNALREFIAVLEINPENEKARAETEQILSIYRTFPDRQPAEDILEQLRELGFQI
ncbi:MAG: hypothetical protein WD357_08460 [Gracilimonas sp.]